MNTEENDQQGEKIRYFNPDNKEITDDQISLCLAILVAQKFVRIQDQRVSMRSALSEAIILFGEKSSLAKEALDKARDVEACWVSIQEEIMPFIREGTLINTEFAHLKDQIEIIDWQSMDNLSEIDSPVSISTTKKLMQARRLAEKLRDELWKHVRKEGEPENPTKKLPWE